MPLEESQNGRLPLMTDLFRFGQCQQENSRRCWGRLRCDDGVFNLFIYFYYLVTDVQVVQHAIPSHPQLFIALLSALGTMAACPPPGIQVLGMTAAGPLPCSAVAHCWGKIKVIFMFSARSSVRFKHEA